jgi:hypothetical protein
VFSPLFAKLKGAKELSRDEDFSSTEDCENIAETYAVKSEITIPDQQTRTIRQVSVNEPRLTILHRSDCIGRSLVVASVGFNASLQKKNISFCVFIYCVPLTRKYSK